MRSLVRTPKGRLLDIQEEMREQPAPLSPEELAALRALRPGLPLPVRDALQLRADVRPPRRLDFFRPVRRVAPVRIRWTTTWRRPIVRTRTSSPTRRATRPSACTRCGRCETRSSRIGAPELLAADERQQLRLEDLLGFRKNPAGMTAVAEEAPRQRRSTATPPRQPRSSGFPPAHRASGWPAPSGWPSGPLDRYGRDAPLRPHRRGRRGHDAGPGVRGDGCGRHDVASGMPSCTSTGTRRR